MATKIRKCDLAKNTQDTRVPRECCPICSLPAAEWKTGSITGKRTLVKALSCSFMKRCEGLKFDDDPAVSARKRSDYFRRYHCDFCPKCRRPKDECRESRIAAVKRRNKKETNDTHCIKDAGIVRDLSDVEFRKMVDAEPCRPPEIKYRPIKPSWYTE